MLHGIDAASYQPDTLAMAGMSFAFVKSTEGTTYANPARVPQVRSVRAAGDVVGHYHFLHAGSIAQQVAFFLKMAPYQPGDMLACDWESPGTGQGSPATDAEKGEFLAELKRARPAARVLLYCNRDFWLHRDQHSVCGDGLWIADPDAPAGHPRIKHPWTFHQYGTAKGTDQNLGQFPDLAALKKWAGVPAPHPTTPPPAHPAPTIDQRVTVLERRVGALEAQEKKEGV
jgi:GH25 family lysozyme M1 (1,4-beta-N-acetylmuramidase)